MNDTTSESLITVGTFPEPASANLAQSALESAGIESVMQGATANSMIPVAFEARLQVRQEDETAARKILDDAEFAPESLADVTEAEAAGEDLPR